jgi:hypothetical protein
MTAPVRIPADVDREDRLIGNLTARQLAILAAGGAILYALWTFADRVLPAWSPTWAAASPWVRLAGFAVAAIPVAVAGLALALGRRDGMPLDRLLLAAARQRLALPTDRGAAHPHGGASSDAARHDEAADSDVASTPARPGRVVVSRVPARDVRASITRPDVGVVELGRDGLALVCTVTPVNLMLRSPSEQDQLVAGMARWLHSLTRPVQVLVRTTPMDLTGHIAELREHAARRPHPALAAAAHAHADHLTDLTHDTDLLRRRIYLVFHEPVPARQPHPSRKPGDSGRADRIGRAVRTAEDQLLRRADEADQLLGAIGARVTPLDPAATAHALLTATNPDQHLYLPLPTSATYHGRRPVPATPEPPSRRAHDGLARNNPAARPAGSPRAGSCHDDELVEAEDLAPTQRIPRPTARSATRAPGRGRSRQVPPRSWAPGTEAQHR